MKVSKIEFFKLALKHKAYLDKRFIMRCFSVTQSEVPDKPFMLTYVDNTVTFKDHDGVQCVIWDYIAKNKQPTAVFSMRDPLTLEKGDLPNVKAKVETTYGQAIVNAVLLVYPFHDKMNYTSGRFSVGDIEKKIIERLKPDNEAGENDISVTEYLRYHEGTSLIRGLTQLSVPSASPKTLTHHPDVDKKKKELFEKYKDRLNDPAVAAIIADEIIKLDDEWLAGDEAEGFFVKGKLKNVSRLAMQGMIGGKSVFQDGVEVTIIENALRDGVKPEDLPVLFNTIREASFDRGAETALGGEAVKRILQVMQNARITEEDCGSKLGYTVKIEPSVKNDYVGLTIIENGKLVKLTRDNIQSYVGKTVTHRTTAFCVTKKTNFCKVCVGDKYAKHPNGLAVASSNVASIFMYIFMKSMHGTAAKNVRYRITDNLF